ncbi:hypothetical protein IFT37_00110 [Pseudomonas fluorescens]|uniref:Uncharacterized protein n=1 Tax=Pseudomonas fluorescens TaxID=294 RepID=A0AAE2PTQ6_PSEFL|nr:hypothetical protein [Pseudomonas fluorescens]MBD8146595.1 hypothetical protein [Pseudomonas fluorescens]MBD8175039.1 hypothetical protein [Pseudomonas fluorescens]MBD8268352.1 hypothetical protein [Pseudomonas fluorescens]MBD8743495.1 hypothetical protein [Pseudomonas fluorescens]MBD8752926.1 hypothetical protein [Pseudomonas fluorescens]
MLFDTDVRAGYKDKIENFLESVNGHASFDYIAALARQVIWFVDQSITLTRGVDGTDFFGRYRTGIAKSLEASPFSVNHLEEAHFLSAKFLRELSYGSKHDFDKSELVLFYLFPSFIETSYKKVDIIRLGVPLEFILEPEVKKINQAVAMLEKINSWEGSLEDWGVRVKKSEARYQGVIDATNFLGLGKAFEKLLQDKRCERDSLRKNLTIVGLVTLIIPFIYLIFDKSNFIQYLISDTLKFSISAISVFVFSIVFEALLLYYFRIIYGQWLVAKKHVLQLSLRHEMCAFVNEYAKSAKDMDRTTLTKFENLVFSELSSDLNAPPSVYDAVDSVAKVISSMRKPEN